MKILHIADRAYPAATGSQVYLHELAARQARDGDSVSIYTTDAYDLAYFWDPHARRVPEPTGDFAGVSVRRFPVSHLPLSALGFPGLRYVNALLGRVPGVPLSLLMRIARYSPYVPALETALQEYSEPLDAVHVMNITLDNISAAASRFAKRRNVPLVVTPFLHLGSPRFYTMRHQIALLKRANAVLVQTRVEGEELAARGVPRERIRLVGVGVNPREVEGGAGTRFRLASGLSGPMVLFLGANAYDKGVRQVVDAMRLLWKRGSEAVLVIAGPPAREFERWLAQIPQAEHTRLHVLGYVSEERKRDLLAACDVLALPSRTESFGIVYLEAWLYNKPVVGARAGAVTEIIRDGETGLLVEFGDGPGLAGALESLLREPARARAMGEAGRARTLAEWTWESRYAAFRRVFQSLTT